jgi:hypothetical protein
MTLAEAKAILAPLCAVKADGKPSSPGYCDADLIGIAEAIEELVEAGEHWLASAG